jgi:hypothetical protein
VNGKEYREGVSLVSAMQLAKRISFPPDTHILLLHTRAVITQSFLSLSDVIINEHNEPNPIGPSRF